MFLSPLYSIDVDCCVGCIPTSSRKYQDVDILDSSSTTPKIAPLMMVVYPGMLLPPIRISVVILLLHIVYMIVVYAFVGGGVMILNSDGIIIIVL